LIDATEGSGGLPDGLIGTPEKIVEMWAMQLLHRYGIVFPEMLAREPMAPRWRELLRVYRRAEAKGEIRGGRFVAGFVGEQFALPEAMEALRSLRKTEPDGRLISVLACDPLNLAGVLTPGPRVPALLGNLVVFRDGVPLGSVRRGELEWHAEIDEATRGEAIALLHRRRKRPQAAQRRRRRLASSYFPSYISSDIRPYWSSRYSVFVMRGGLLASTSRALTAFSERRSTAIIAIAFAGLITA
jgi:hypothetical protein